MLWHLQSTAIGVTGCSGLSNVGAGDQTWALWESRTLTTEVRFHPLLKHFNEQILLLLHVSYATTPSWTGLNE